MNHKKKKLLRSLQLLLEQVQEKRLQQKTYFRKRKKPTIIFESSIKENQSQILSSIKNKNFPKGKIS